MGLLISIVILAAILFGPAIAILRTSGPSSPKRLFWFVVSISPIAVPLVVTAYIRHFRDDAAYDAFRKLWIEYDPYIIFYIYFAPIFSLFLFRIFVARQRNTDEEAGDKTGE